MVPSGGGGGGASATAPHGRRGDVTLPSPGALSYTEQVYDSSGGVQVPEGSLPGTAEWEHVEPAFLVVGGIMQLKRQPHPQASGPGVGGGDGAGLVAQRTVSHGGGGGGASGRYGGGGGAVHSWSGLVDVSAGPVRGGGSGGGGGGGGGNAIGGVPLVPVAPGGRAARAVELLSRARSNLGRVNAGGSGPQPTGALSPV